MATVSSDADEIRRQMAAIRRELHEDVKEVVATAEAAADWRNYLTMYPWVSLGVAFAVGYFIVPRRHRTAEALAATQSDISKVREAVESAGKKAAAAARETTTDEPAKRRKGLIGAALGMAAPLVLRAAQGYAMKYLEQWVMNQHLAAAQAGPPPVRHPGHPGGMGPQTPGGMGPGGFGPGPGPGPGRPSGPRHADGPGAF